MLISVALPSTSALARARDAESMSPRTSNPSAERRSDVKPRHAGARDADAHTVLEDVAGDGHAYADVCIETVQSAVSLEDFRRLGHGKCYGYGLGTTEGGFDLAVDQPDYLSFPVIHFLSLMYSTDLCNKVSKTSASLSTSSGKPKLTARYPLGS